MKTNKRTLSLIAALVAAALLVTVTASGALSASQTLASSGSIQVTASINIGLYSDSACTQSAAAITWGTLEPGGAITRTLYVKNTGNSNAVLSMATSNWTPTNAQSGITLSWNVQGRTLAPNEVVQATLTLTVSSTIDAAITTFNFNIQITGTA
jgi:hypothetical protein